MKKRTFRALLCLGLFAMTLTSCGNINPYADDPRYPIYQLALESGFTGTYQEWLDSIKGEDGRNGETPHIGENGNWWIGDTDTGVPARGPEGPEGPAGSDGQPGSQGEPGKDGNTPYIGENGNWWIGDTDTGVPATGKDGQDGSQGPAGSDGQPGSQGEPGKDGKDGIDGKDGTSMHTGHGAPSSDLGQVGDSYVDLDTWDFYVKYENGWVLEGNIKGNNGSDYERETHTITFDSNGGSAVETQYVLHGEKIAKPENPVRLGYEFSCWTYQDEPWSFVGYTCTEDMTLVANWTLSEYTATFVNYNGEILDYQTGLHYGDSVTYRGATPIKPSDEAGIAYEFTGWDKELLVVDNMIFTAQFKTVESGYVINHPVTINFWHNFNNQYATVIRNFIEEFEEVEPNITVNLVTQIGGYDDLNTKVIQGFSAGNYPDIGISYPHHIADYIDYGKVVRLDEDFINNERYGWTDEDLEDIIPNHLEEGASYAIPGTYSLPFAELTEAMFYNADVLIGLDLSSVDATINGGNPLTHEYLNNLTWEELFDKLCPAIVAHNAALPADEQYLHDDKEYHGVVGYDSDDNLFITLAEQYGYGYTAIDEATGTGKVLFDNEGMKSLMKTFNKAYQDGYFITKGSTGYYLNSLFTQQNVLFSIGSTGSAKYQYTDNFETGVARIPAAQDGNRHVINQGPSLTILDHNDDTRALASWLFCKFMLNKENATTWAIESGYEPIRYSCYDTDEYKSYLDYLSNSDDSDALLARVHKYCRSVVDDLYNSCNFKGSSRCRTTVGELVCLCLIEENLDEYIDKYFKDAVNNCLIFISN